MSWRQSQRGPNNPWLMNKGTTQNSGGCHEARILCVFDYMFVFIGAVFVALRFQKLPPCNFNRTESNRFKGVPED